jgi:methyl-accepting chemotaxis protein
MAATMTLGKRIGLGILIMLILMLTVGLAGYFGLNRVLNVVEFYKGITKLQLTVGAVKGNMDQYFLAAYGREKASQEKSQKEAFAALDGAVKELTAIKTQSTVDDNGMRQIELAERKIEEYQKAVKEYIDAEGNKESVETQAISTYGEIDKLMEGGKLFMAEQMGVAGKVFSSDFVEYVSRSNDTLWEKAERSLVALQKTINEWATKMEEFGTKMDGTDFAKTGEGLKGLAQSLKTATSQYHAVVKKQEALRNQVNSHTKDLLKIFADLGQISLTKLQHQSGVSLKIIFGFIIAALLIGSGYAVVSIKAIVRKIKSAISGINEGAQHVGEAAEQVTLASQALAEGASEQAGAIEETSSSLEEISSMTRQSADRASTAKDMMREASEIVNRVNNHMNDMTVAIEEVNRSSEETSKIIKTIDEIAFQTNLLALNAAVEAARAGEAGAGFAVVADEVRNLAMRAAEAARNTTTLIENTIKTVKNGNELTKLTREAFNENLQISNKVAQFIEEIATSSDEQAQGIGQVNVAVAEMDKVVQRNAASAEESASAAKDMHASATHLKQIVDDMNILVEGKRKARDSRKTGHNDLARSRPKGLTGTEKQDIHPAPLNRNPNEIGPKQQIPFDTDGVGEDTRLS